MAALSFSTKRVQIDKAKTVVVGSVAAASFIVIFSIIASKALLSQRSYQSRVIAKQEKAVKQLRENIKAVDQLETSYKQFINQPNNILGGNPAGQGEKDGDNARIILDALPSKYDFPALTTSLEKILTSKNLKIEAITGTDDEVNQDNQTNSGVTSAPVEMPFKFTVTGTYDSIQSLIDTLQHSIRPLNVQTIGFSGKNSQLRLELGGTTYYLPEKQLTFPTEEVK